LKFKNTLLAAKQGDEDEFAALFARYKRKIKYFSYFDDKYDEDLESELYITFLRCIRTFNIDYKTNNTGAQKT